MVLQITQDTFDNTVKENMEEFDMNLSDAIQDTVKQYEAQGVDLSHIIVDLIAVKIESENMNQAIETLKQLAPSISPGDKSLIPVLKTLQDELKQGLTYQVIAGKSGTYTYLLNILTKENIDDENLEECLKTYIVLMTKQPDLLNERGVVGMMKILDENKNQQIINLLLSWIRECCILHEYNRQHIFDAGILDRLKLLLNEVSSELLCAILSVLRALVLDDDIRVEFGRAHDHAKAIANDFLSSITTLIGKFQYDDKLMNELLITLSALLVRTEFCKQVEEAGVLDIIKNVLEQYGNNDKLIRQCFKVLKALAGNDECKVKVIKLGTAPILVSSLNQNKSSATTAALGLGCLASLTLRSPDNSEVFYNAGAPVTIIEIMKLHPDNEAVQKNAAWAIRNMVSRCRQQNKEFIRLGVEPLLKSALSQFKKSEYDIKAALRDLECDVELKEEWTGKGGKLQTDATTAK